VQRKGHIVTVLFAFTCKFAFVHSFIP
jgi:hypothetical protein